MGKDIENSDFSPDERAMFRDRLRHETATLKQWFDQQAFDEDERFTVGLELEGWLVDHNHMPSPRNTEFFAHAQDPDIVAELSRFNFEINASPRTLDGAVLSQTHQDIRATWAKCRVSADALNLKPVAIGILPTVRDEMLQLDWMSDSERYRALNRELFRRREDVPLSIDIQAQDHLQYRCNHLMLEAACTSLQAHLKINQSDAVRFYNAAVLAAGPLVAATANSPFLYSHALWEETRIPAFEQSTALDGFRDLTGRHVQRVTLGTGYLRESMMELFLQNLSFPDLLPALMEDDRDLPHLQMQNGTIWRWVRPILGFDKSGAPHLRIEHRVIPAGPSLQDTVANLALCHGLMIALAREDRPPELDVPFDVARANFYACAESGLRANVTWNGTSVNVQSLLLERLLPAARRALQDQGVDPADLDLYFHDTLEPRLRTGMTGAQWQRSFIDCNGRNFQALTEAYVHWQASDQPVHSWAV